jgi:DNA polymerase
VHRSKREPYDIIVASRQSYDSERALGLANPSRVAGGRFDADEIGPWTRWAGDLDADLMVVGQDWGDVAYFKANQGLDKPDNPTSVALAELLASVGRPLPRMPTAAAPLPPGGNRHSRVFLTNALLWLKTGGMQARTPAAWFDADAAARLREQIDLVRPRVVVALGQQAHRAILRAYDLPVPAGPFRAVVDAPDGTPLPGGPPGTLLFGVYHCGARVRNTCRSSEQQRRDWTRIARDLGSA